MPDELATLDQRASQILKADHRQHKRIVWVDIGPAANPGSILYLDQHEKPKTAWVWHREGALKPLVWVECGFVAEPSEVPTDARAA